MRWAEQQGYRLDLASLHDLHFRPEILEAYKCVVFVGHDEYWTWEMRDAVDRYVEAGGGVRDPGALGEVDLGPAPGDRPSQPALLRLLGRQIVRTDPSEQDQVAS